MMVSVNETCRRRMVPIGKVAPALLRQHNIPFEQRGRFFWVPTNQKNRLIEVVLGVQGTHRDTAAARGSRPAGQDRVYFLKCGEYLKIGIASDVQRRLRHLRVGCPYPIELLADIPGGLALELALHRRFGHLHHQGEWFWLDDDLSAFVTAIRDNAGLGKSQMRIWGIEYNSTETVA